MLSAVFLGRRLLARFFEARGEDGFGMAGGPAAGKPAFKSRVIRRQAQQQFSDVGPGFKAMPFRAGQERVQNRRTRSCVFAPEE